MTRHRCGGGDQRQLRQHVAERHRSPDGEALAVVHAERRDAVRISSVSTYSATVLMRHAARELRDRAAPSTPRARPSGYRARSCRRSSASSPAAAAGMKAKTSPVPKSSSATPQPRRRSRRMSASARAMFATVAFSVSSKQNTRRVEAAALRYASSRKSPKVVIVQRLAGEVDREAHGLRLASSVRVGLQQRDGLVDDPTVDRRHELVAVGGRQEPVGAERLRRPRRSSAAAARSAAARAAPAMNGAMSCASRRSRSSAIASRRRAAMLMSVKRRTMLGSSAW